MPLGIDPPLHRRRVDFWTKSRAFTIGEGPPAARLRAARGARRGDRAHGGVVPRGRLAVSEPVAGRRRTWARGTLVAIAVAIVVATASLDLPRASRSEFWGDSATYYAMAWSLARDLDLRFEARDLERVRAEYPGGPQGLFLKRASGGLTVDVAAASRGCDACGRTKGGSTTRRRSSTRCSSRRSSPCSARAASCSRTASSSRWRSCLATSILRRRGFGELGRARRGGARSSVTVAPLYLVWPSPEILGLTLATGGLWAWATGRPLLSAALFGAAGYLKPPNLLMAAPLGFDPLLPAAGERLPGRGFAGRLGEALRRGIVMVGNGGAALRSERRDHRRAELPGRGEEDVLRLLPVRRERHDVRLGGRVDDDEPARSARRGTRRGEGHGAERAGPQARRAGGVVPLEPRLLLDGPLRRRARLLLPGGARTAFSSWSRVRATAPAGSRAAAIGISWIAYLRLIPDNWYGGGGTVGNRYFLNVLPGFLFVLPRRRLALVARGRTRRRGRLSRGRSSRPRSTTRSARGSTRRAARGVCSRPS